MLIPTALATGGSAVTHQNSIRRKHSSRLYLHHSIAISITMWSFCYRFEANTSIFLRRISAQRWFTYLLFLWASAVDSVHCMHPFCESPRYYQRSALEMFQNHLSDILLRIWCDYRNSGLVCLKVRVLKLLLSFQDISSIKSTTRVFRSSFRLFILIIQVQQV